MFSVTKIVAALSCTIGYALAFDGDLTYYQPGLGSCGETSSATDKIVALSPSKFTDQADLCGKTITIEFGSKNTTAKIVDKCPGCSADSIDVSPAVFEDLADLSVGRAQVSWSIN